DKRSPPCVASDLVGIGHVDLAARNPARSPLDANLEPATVLGEDGHWLAFLYLDDHLSLLAGAVVDLRRLVGLHLLGTARSRGRECHDGSHDKRESHPHGQVFYKPRAGPRTRRSSNARGRPAKHPRSHVVAEWLARRRQRVPRSLGPAAPAGA